MQNLHTVKKNHGQIARLGFLATFTTVATAMCLVSSSHSMNTVAGMVFGVSGCSLMGFFTLVFEDHSDAFTTSWRDLLWSPKNKAQAYVSATLLWCVLSLVLLIVALVVI